MSILKYNYIKEECFEGLGLNGAKQEQIFTFS
jgi:hypothetical protein